LTLRVDLQLVLISPIPAAVLVTLRLIDELV
jgi:hypothetical protein